MEELRKQLGIMRDELSAIVAKGAEATEDELTRGDQLVTDIRKTAEELDRAQARAAALADAEERATVAAEVEARDAGTERQTAQVRVSSEPRTYRADQDPHGKQFLRDLLARDVLRSHDASERLARHMSEEYVERGAALQDRAAGTGAFSGLVVPQYLTDLFAPKARAGRPLADAMRKHDLPPSGMTVEIGRMTTGTSTAVQTQGSAASETDVDDTILPIPVQTVAGSQTLTRQAIERGTGVEDATLQDLFASYATTLDSTLINQATTGLTNVATGITYTDASPTGAELFPKLLQSLAAVETALLNQDPNGTAVVMHPRRWYWLQSQLSSTFPLIGQQFGLGFNAAGAVEASGYGPGFRGFLPNGTPVIVDANVPTNLGDGTDQDEVYAVSLGESHLWEDADAPMLIRTETGPSVKSLGVDIVVYGYVAYTFARQAHAQKIGGTGLVAPTWA